MGISLHQIRVVDAFKQHPDRWLSNREIGELAGVASRTARNYTWRLVKAHVLDERRVYPGFRYRWRQTATTVPHYAAVVAAREAFSFVLEA